jgi:hypothetical protein
MPAARWLLAAGVVAAAALLTPCHGLDNGLGRTPPLGWSSWNYFATHINETLFREMADAMVQTGLAAAGFEYINVDAGYLVKQRNANGSLVADPALFPSGIRALADYVHSKGLKLGVYTDLTSHTCGPGPGSYQHYEQDARTIALEWQADYLKVDYCGEDVDRSPAPQLAAWQSLRDALNATGRPVYFSICPHAVAPAIGPAKPCVVECNRSSGWAAAARWWWCCCCCAGRGGRAGKRVGCSQKLACHRCLALPHRATITTDTDQDAPALA